jgi:hypothetical protein
MHTIETLTTDDDPRIPAGFTVTLSYDVCPVSPREGEDMWTICTTHRDYVAIDEEYTDGCIPEDADMVVPVYLYEHGSTCYRAGESGNPFRHIDPVWSRRSFWGSGQIGVAYLPAGTLDAEYGDDPGREDKARRYLDGELSVYTQWANGDVYCFDVTDPLGNFTDGCTGFYGLDEVREEAIAAAVWAGRRRDREAAETQRRAILDGLGVSA